MYTELTLTLALSVAASVTCSFPLMLKRQEEPPTVYFQSKALCAFGVKQAIKSMGIIVCLPICVNHL